MKIEIKNRFTGDIILCGEYESIRDCLEKNRKADLSEADLSWANLSRANLSEADLSWANLSWADLSGADLSWADLSEADLSLANLSGADLSGAKIFDEVLDKTPIQILGLKWSVFITKQNIKIGCEVHKVDEWKKFKDSRIKLMDSGAVDWWKIYKPVIMQLHEEHIKAED